MKRRAKSGRKKGSTKRRLAGGRAFSSQAEKFLRGRVRRLEAELGVLRAKAQRLVDNRDFRRVIDASPIPLSVDDMHGSIVSLIRKFIEKFGYSKREIPTSAAWFEKAYPDAAYRSRVARQWKVMLQAGLQGGKEVGPMDVEVTCKDGSRRRIEFVGTQLGDRLLLAANDITERMRLEKEILEISEQEQQRIGQDLHDGVCQLLSGLKFKATLLEQKLQAKHMPEAQEASLLEFYLSTAIEQARQLAKGLHPVDLEARGLMSALEELAENVQDLYGVECACRFRGPVLVHDHVKATHLYRIAQEAINNAIRHGKAARIVIRLAGAGGRIAMMVNDNGAGFSDKPGKRGMGLHLMSYRARAIGASLTIRRTGSRGTTVSCALRPDAAARQRNSHGKKKQH